MSLFKLVRSAIKNLISFSTLTRHKTIITLWIWSHLEFIKALIKGQHLPH